MRILIAEDDQVLADGLLRTLRGSGAAVDHVASGTEADAALMTNNEFALSDVAARLAGTDATLATAISEILAAAVQELVESELTARIGAALR